VPLSWCAAHSLTQVHDSSIVYVHSCWLPCGCNVATCRASRTRTRLFWKEMADMNSPRGEFSFLLGNVADIAGVFHERNCTAQPCCTYWPISPAAMPRSRLSPDPSGQFYLKLSTSVFFHLIVVVHCKVMCVDIRKSGLQCYCVVFLWILDII